MKVVHSLFRGAKCYFYKTSCNHPVDLVKKCVKTLACSTRFLSYKEHTLPDVNERAL